MSDQHTDASGGAIAMAKVSIAWVGALVGSITLQQIVLVLTAIYTAGQLYVLVRDKLIRKDE